MKNRYNRFGVLLLITFTGASLACGDGGSTTSTGSSSGAGGAGGQGGSESSSSSGSGGSGGSGGAPAQASPGSELVSGGSVVKSGKYRLIISFGTSTPGPGIAASPSHRLSGGLVGVTEGSK